MNGTKKPTETGAPLAAHFETKRRILATVKQMEECGEKLEEATPEEILEAATKLAETVFKFDFSISDKPNAVAISAKKRNRNRKRSSKRRAKQKDDEVARKSEDVIMFQMGNAKDKQDKSLVAKQTKQKVTMQTCAASSFLKLRKATGTESEVAKMHLRYGQGRRNLVASKQREQRKKMTDAHMLETTGTSSIFKFNFSASLRE